MLISIITPAFQSEKTIGQCLSSVSKQSYGPLEHIVVDGLSKDKTPDIVLSFPHVHSFISEADTGMYYAINKGIHKSSGDIIGILNSDDFYVNNQVIEKVMKMFDSRPVDAVYGDLNYVDKDDIHKVVRKWRSGEYNKDRFLQGWMPPHPAFFIRKTCYQKFGSFNTGFSISADYELMLRMLYQHEISCAYLPEVLVAMRTGGKSNISWKARWKANQEDRLAWKVNGLKPGPFTLWMKPLSKVGQFFGR